MTALNSRRALRAQSSSEPPPEGVWVHEQWRIDAAEMDWRYSVLKSFGTELQQIDHILSAVSEGVCPYDNQPLTEPYLSAKGDEYRKCSGAHCWRLESHPDRVCAYELFTKFDVAGEPGIFYFVCNKNMDAALNKGVASAK